MIRCRLNRAPARRGRRSAFLAALLLPLLAACVAAADGGLLHGRVLRVVDGDTLDVRLSGGRIRVRLQGVDAPEHDQPGGREATQFLRRHLNDRDVLLEPVTQDRYDRLVAVVRLGNLDLNRELVREGHAWAYRRYLRPEERELCRLEHQARQSGRGLWQGRLGPARAPWEHRATGGKGPFTDFARSDARDCQREAGLRTGG